MNRLLNLIKRLLLRLVLGRRTYKYMCGSLKADSRLRNCRMADIVVRKDAVERRVEADWLKALYRIVEHDKTPGFMPREEFEAVNRVR
jgi:hypothetical protein